MWDLIVSVPDHCSSIYFVLVKTLIACDTAFYAIMKDWYLFFQFVYFNKSHLYFGPLRSAILF